MKNCVLVMGGEIRDTALFRLRLDDAELVLAADSGARHLLRLGIIPEEVFGDLDSLTKEEVERLESSGCRFVRFPGEKNETDGAIILKEALSRGFRSIRVWGALGGRPDHSYANIMLLQFTLLPMFHEIYGSAEDSISDVVIEDGGLRIFLAKRGQWIEGKKGEYLSFFAVSPEVTGFEQTGLKYQPAGNRFISGYPLGLSNEFIEDKVWVNWKKGTLLCMHIDGSAYGRAEG